MKKPKIAPFDNTHPIWEEVLEWYRNRSQSKGVYASSYSNLAYCASCGWSGSYSEYQKGQFSCPVCGAGDATNSYISYHENQRGTLIVDKKDDIIIFRFIAFNYRENEHGVHFSASEAYRIYTDENEYEVYKLTDGKTLKKFGNPTMDHNYGFRKEDIYERHNYDAMVYDNDFIQSLDVLHEPLPLETVFASIAQKAAQHAVSKVCPTFTTALPTSDFLLNTNHKGISYSNSHINHFTSGNARIFQAWCGSCGEFSQLTKPINTTPNFVSHSCSCGASIHFDGRGQKYYRNRANAYVDVQFDKDCTTLRYTIFEIESSIVGHTFIPNKKCDVKMSAKIRDVLYVCIYADKTVAIFNKDMEPLTYLDWQNVCTDFDVVNVDLIASLENDAFTSATGFIEFAESLKTLGVNYFFGYMRTENAQELVKSNLHSLIADLANPRTSNIPAYVLKNNKKLAASMFSEEQLFDFSISLVTMDYFVGFMQIFRKDPTIIYSNYCALVDACGKNCLSEIYRRVPDARFADIFEYLSRLNVDEALSPADSIPIWTAYLYSAKSAGLNLSDAKVCFPKNLKMTHDLLMRSCRTCGISEDVASNYEEIAQKADIFAENDTWIVRTVKNIAEFQSLQGALLNSQHVYKLNDPDRFTLAVFDHRTNTPKYLIDIVGVFENDILKSGQVQQIFAFGNSSTYGRYRYTRILNSVNLLGEIFKKYNIT